MHKYVGSPSCSKGNKKKKKHLVCNKTAHISLVRHEQLSMWYKETDEKL